MIGYCTPSQALNHEAGILQKAVNAVKSSDNTGKALDGHNSVASRIIDRELRKTNYGLLAAMAKRRGKRFDKRHIEKFLERFGHILWREVVKLAFEV